MAGVHISELVRCKDTVVDAPGLLLGGHVRGRLSDTPCHTSTMLLYTTITTRTNGTVMLRHVLLNQLHQKSQDCLTDWLNYPGFDTRYGVIFQLKSCRLHLCLPSSCTAKTPVWGFNLKFAPACCRFSSTEEEHSSWFSHLLYCQIILCFPFFSSLNAMKTNSKDFINLKKDYITISVCWRKKYQLTLCTMEEKLHKIIMITLVQI